MTPGTYSDREWHLRVQARVYFLLSRRVAPLLALECSVLQYVRRWVPQAGPGRELDCGAWCGNSMGLSTAYDGEAFADDTPALFPWRTAGFTLATYAYMWQVACAVQAGHESLRAEAKMMMVHREADTHTGRQLAAIRLLVRQDGTRTFSPVPRVEGQQVTPRAIVKRWLIAVSLLLLVFVLLQPAYVWRVRRWCAPTTCCSTHLYCGGLVQLELESARAMSVPPYGIGALNRRGIRLAQRVCMVIIEMIRSVVLLLGHYIVLPALKIVVEPANVLYALQWTLAALTSIASFLVWPLQQLARLLSLLPLPW